LRLTFTFPLLRRIGFHLFLYQIKKKAQTVAQFALRKALHELAESRDLLAVAQGRAQGRGLPIGAGTPAGGGLASTEADRAQKHEKRRSWKGLRCPASAGENGGHFDGHEKIRELNAELGNGARWRIGGEELGVLFVEAGEVAGFGEEHLDLDDILETGAGRAQNGLTVHKRLAGLLLDGGPGHLIGRRIHAGGPRHIDGGAHLDGLAEERRAGRAGSSNDLSGHVESSKELVAVRE